MSLVKLYRLDCEGPYLARRKGRPEGAVQHLKVVCKGRTRDLHDTAPAARRHARQLGWTRRQVFLPINPDNLTIGTTQIAFDLCPNCTELIPS